MFLKTRRAEGLLYSCKRALITPKTRGIVVLLLRVSQFGPLTPRETDLSHRRSWFRGARNRSAPNKISCWRIIIRSPFVATCLIAIRGSRDVKCCAGATI